jgi:ParB family chromosome partitioning protein
MEVVDIPVSLIDVSGANTRKDLRDGQFDSTIEDLARSIERQGLLSPITVFPKPEGRYALVAGQRRLLAFQYLGRETIPAILHEAMTEETATAVSLVENVHRADMNPRDKAMALKVLVDRLGGVHAVSKETGLGEGTIPEVPPAPRPRPGAPGASGRRGGQEHRGPGEPRSAFSRFASWLSGSGSRGSARTSSKPS